MPAKRPKPARKAAAKRSAPKGSKTPAKPIKPKARQKPVKRKAPVSQETRALDLSALPAENVTQLEKWICLACVLDVFTRHMGLSTRTAHLEIKRYAPSVQELYTPAVTRPYFGKSVQDGCPYCGSPSKWHARLRVHRIESTKATDASRRQIVKSLPAKQFLVLEEQTTRQHAFFEWLDKISAGLDLDDPKWLSEVSRHYLGRKDPKVDWRAQFDQAHSIRRSRRLESGWELDDGRLFLSPDLFDELLLVQYLVSRSHKAGGLTLEGRYTLGELFGRLRRAGYLRAVNVRSDNPADALEQLLHHLAGGEASFKLYYIVDRRDFLKRVNALGLTRPPKPQRL